MDEKEMRLDFEEFAESQGYLLNLADDGKYYSTNTRQAFRDWQSAYACIMGKADPVYQVKGEFWQDVSKTRYETVFLKTACRRIFYTAPPMQNPKREIVLPELPDPYITEGGRYWNRALVEEAMRAAVELDRKARS